MSIFKIIKDKKYKEAEKLWKYYDRILRKCKPFTDEYYYNRKQSAKYRELVLQYRKQQINNYEQEASELKN